MSNTNRRGANAIEYALTVPVLIAIVFGLIEFSWFFYGKSTVTTAVHDGCREGALVSVETNDPIEVARTEIGNRLAGFDLLLLEVELTGDAPNESLSCRADADYVSLIRFLPTGGSYSVDVEMRLEIQR